jgi:aminopeptidase C
MLHVNIPSENVYEIIVHKKVLPLHLRYDPDHAILLPPWDAMSNDRFTRSKL